MIYSVPSRGTFVRSESDRRNGPATLSEAAQAHSRHQLCHPRVAGQQYAPDVEELARLSSHGLAELWLTTAFDDDQERAGDARRASNLHWISQRPVMGQITQPLRLDYNSLDGRSVLIDERTADAGRAIEQILGVGALDTSDSRNRARWRKRIRDVQHLMSHILHDHDVFVTSDDDDMLKKRDELHRRTGIVIDSPAEAVRRVKRAGSRAPGQP